LNSSDRAQEAHAICVAWGGVPSKG
jgi:hypothetical protein